MATWNHGDKTAGSTVQFNGKSYVTRKDTGQTVYDTVAAVAGDPGVSKEIADLRKQLAGVSTGAGAGFGEVQFAGSDNTTYYYRRIEGDTSKTVREEFETGVLAMTDGSKPSAAILMINCVNLNDSTFANKDKSRAQVMYKSPASEIATPSCYINSRGGTTSTFSAGSFVTGKYTGDGTGSEPIFFQRSGGSINKERLNIDLGFRPVKVEIYSNETLKTTERNNIASDPLYPATPAWTVVSPGEGKDPVVEAPAGRLSSIAITDNGFQVGSTYTYRSGTKNSPTLYYFGPNTKDVEYTYLAYATADTTVSQSTNQGATDTYGPGTQAIVPVHADGKVKLIAYINKLATGTVPKDCFLELWVVGVMGGGGSVPDNNYANLLKRVETLESTSGGSGNQATGIYTGRGNGSYTTTVNLGFRPKVVQLIERSANVMLYEDSAGHLTGSLNWWTGTGGKYDDGRGDWMSVRRLGYTDRGVRITHATGQWVDAAFKFTDTGFEISTSRPPGMGGRLTGLDERPFFGRNDGMYIAAG